MGIHTQETLHLPRKSRLFSRDTNTRSLFYFLLLFFPVSLSAKLVLPLRNLDALGCQKKERERVRERERKKESERGKKSLEKKSRRRARTTVSSKKAVASQHFADDDGGSSNGNAFSMMMRLLYSPRRAGWEKPTLLP